VANSNFDCNFRSASHQSVSIVSLPCFPLASILISLWSHAIIGTFIWES